MTSHDIVILTYCYLVVPLVADPEEILEEMVTQPNAGCLGIELIFGQVLEDRAWKWMKYMTEKGVWRPQRTEEISQTKSNFLVTYIMIQKILKLQISFQKFHSFQTDVGSIVQVEWVSRTDRYLAMATITFGVTKHTSSTNFPWKR